MKPRAFLTGASGFLGPHVSAALAAQGFDVFASTTPLRDLSTLKTELANGPWDLVFHMAGISLPAECRDKPSYAYETNFSGTLEVVELCSKADVRGPFIFFSSAYVYSPDLSGRINEQCATEPASVYGRTKLFSEQALSWIAPHLKFPVLALRLFNQSHMSQPGDFFLPTMYRTLKEAKPGKKISVPMGNPNLLRDFGAIQDFRSIMERLVQERTAVAGEISSKNGNFKAVNLCSGQPRQLGVLVKTLAKKMHLEIELEPKAERMRPGEPESVCGDPTALTRLLKFAPIDHSDEKFIELFLQPTGLK